MKSGHAGAGTPDPRLVFDPGKLRLREQSRAFYRRDTVEVARSLIGGWFARFHDGRWYGARIVETEAYLGARDAAAHSYGGRRTPRVEPMYRDGGHLYVYFVYGMHYCANVVTGIENVAEAVLLRAAEGPPGTPPKLLSGPARFCKALGLSTQFSGTDLLEDSRLKLFGRNGPEPVIGSSQRIGVDYAGEAKDWPLRFFEMDSPAVSGPARLRRIAKP